MCFKNRDSRERFHKSHFFIWARKNERGRSQYGHHDGILSASVNRILQWGLGDQKLYYWKKETF